MSTLMRCLEQKGNRIDVETVHEKVEVRKGRLLRVIVKQREQPSSCGNTSVMPLAGSPDSENVKINPWVNIHEVVTDQSRIGQQDGIGNQERIGQQQERIVLFFIHGVGGCADVWYQQIEYFTKFGYIVVAPDLLGHGGSDAPRDANAYEFSELACDMFAVFDRYRSANKNILVGHSYGCSFCTNIASQRPRQVSKMVLISGGGPIPLYPEPCHLFCLPACILACLKPFLVWTFHRNGFHTHTSQDTVQFPDAFKVPSYVLRATMNGQNWNEGDEQFHSDLLVATLLIYGCYDNFVSLQEEAYMQETIYGSKLEVVENAGHMVMLECPDKVNELIFQFLTRDASTQSGFLTCSTFWSRRLKTSLSGKTSSTTLQETEVNI